ncbi:MAG: glycosyltransferase, partial [Kamptonema sp. SIO4C4]|nr:glycosyltransferase [Kamptonema sp. SIO4C4]
MRPTVSIVIPLYYAESLCNVLIEELEALSLTHQEQFSTEIIFVDDGSKDRTFELIRQLNPQHFQYRALRLARNFKSYIAILAGIHHARGDYITFLPQDLQEPPTLVEQLYQELQNGYDVAWAVWRSRGDLALYVQEP